MKFELDGQAIVVCGRRYCFCEVDPDDGMLRIEGSMALCDSYSGAIVYQSGLPEDSLKSVVLHELIHAVDRETGTDKNLLTEDQVQRIAAVLFGSFRSNPDLINWLVDEEEE